MDNSLSNNMKDRIELNGKKILITGAAGFIGGALSKRLLELFPDISIFGIDDLNDYYDTSLKKARLKELEGRRGFEFFKLDISDREGLSEAFGQIGPDLVVNLAAQAGVRYSMIDPDAYISSNIIGFYNILELCRKSRETNDRDKGVQHLVFASSSSVYGSNTKIPYSTEDKTDCPLSLYAATKKSNELLAHAYSKLYNIPATGLRYFTVYGPLGRPDMAYFGFTNKILKGEKINIFNYGDCRRDFTYIDDVVESTIAVMQLAPTRNDGADGLPIPPFSVYNIGNSAPEGLTEFVDILCSELKQKGLLDEDYDIREHEVLLPMQPGDVAVTYADTRPLEELTGISPKTNLRDGLKKFVDWYAGYYYGI